MLLLAISLIYQTFLTPPMCRETKERTWKKPLGFDGASSSASSSASSVEAATTNSSSSSSSSKKVTIGDTADLDSEEEEGYVLPKGWRAVQDKKTGKLFYVNE